MAGAPLIDIAALLVVAVVTYCVAAGGAVEAGIVLLCTLFGGILATNFYEPLAALMDGTSAVGRSADVIAFLVLFGGLTTLARLACEFMSPVYVNVDATAHEVGRWVCSLLTGYATAAVLMVGLHVSALPREFLGFSPERPGLFGIPTFAPDRQWLGLMQYLTEKPFNSGPGQVFDGRSAAQYGIEVFDEAGRPLNANEALFPSFVIRHAD
ncbi:MAG: CvpA family protein, partial [Planctomycetota bacterium]